MLFSVYIWNHNYISRLIADLAKLRPDMAMVAGGPQAASLTRLPGNCAVVQGEVEGLGEDFYRDLEAGRLESFYQAGQSRSFPSPYRDHDFSDLLKNRQIYYESSRGCPFSCSYCLSSISKGVRYKPLETVKQELLELIASNPLIIKFVDRTFNADQGRALAIWQFLKEHGAGVKFHFEIAPDRFTDEMFDFLATVDDGLFQFEIGIQSCNPETLSAVNRRMDVDRAVENILRLVTLDTIHLHVDLILGLPFEDRKGFQLSFNRVFRLAPHYIQLGLLKVLPGTEIEKRALDHGIVSCSQPPYEVLATRWLDHRELRELHQLCEVVESFYNNRFFRSLWHYLIESDEDPFVFFAALARESRKHQFLELARTHKLMNRILFELVRKRQDSELLLELLSYDWLSCGHRRLPEYLTETSQADLRNRLRLELPENLDGVFDYRSRVEFLKQATFLELSCRAMELVGVDGPERAVLAFLPVKKSGVMKRCRVLGLRPVPFTPIPFSHLGSATTRALTDSGTRRRRSR